MAAPRHPLLNLTAIPQATSHFDALPTAIVSVRVEAGDGLLLLRAAFGCAALGSAIWAVAVAKASPLPGTLRRGDR